MMAKILHTLPARVLALVVALATPGAGAQPTQDRDRPDVSITAQFGWGGKVLPADRFAPIRVTLSGADRSLGGMLVMEFQQDATQRARILTPAATTPGMATEYEILAAMPAGCDSVTFSLLDERGRLLSRQAYSTFDSRRTLAMGVVPSPNSLILVAAGRAAPIPHRPSGPTETELADENRGINTPNPLGSLIAAKSPAEAEDAWLAAAPVRHELEALPTSWAAYEGVATLIIDAESASSLDPLALDAIRTWVLWGGRLAIVADTPTQGWPRWFESPVQAPPIELGEVERVPTPASLAALIEPANAGIKEEDRADQVMSALHVRALRLTEAGLAHGWTLSHATESGAGLVAEGPFGFGWIVVLGFDPALASATESTRTAGVLWRATLATALEPWLKRTNPSDMYGWWAGSGGDAAENEAIEEALNSLDRLSLPIDFTFTLIALATFLLAMVVGPVNAIVLKRLQLQHAAWLATIACALVAGVVGWLLPGMIRASPTTLFRTSLEDILVSPDPTLPPMTWRTVTTGLMTNTNGRVDLEHADPRGFWRGVSPLWSGDTQIGPAFETLQAGTGVEGWRQRGGAPRELTQNQWSLRTALALEPTGLPVFATITQTDDAWTIDLTGLPDDAEVHSAGLAVGDNWHILRPESQQGPTRRFTSLGPRPEDAPTGAPEWRSLGLPGAWQRGAAAETRAQSGRWAVVSISCSQDSPDFTLDTPGVRYRTDRTLRIHVPLSEPHREPTP